MKTTLYFTLTLLTFVTFAFVPNSLAQDASPEYVARVIYFVPNDREPDPNMDEKLDIQMKDAQQFYADQMEVHGFGRKTFRLETDDGNAKVHQVNGKFSDAYYLSTPWMVWGEIEEQFDMSKNIYYVALDTTPQHWDSDTFGGRLGGIGFGDSHSGRTLIPAAPIRGLPYSLFGDATIHELGHAFGLLHDKRRNGKWIASTPLITVFYDKMITSFCAAEWLDVHRYFNPTQEVFNEDTSVQMLIPSLAEPPSDFLLRFEVTDPDGLHQVQLFSPLGDTLIACQRLSGKSNAVEFVTDKLVGSNTIVLRVIDVHGNFTNHSFPINITDLLPPLNTFSIPDPNLAAAVRKTLGLAPDNAITRLDILRLTSLTISNPQIIDFTGLEQAANLETLFVEGNKISDVSPLTELTNLDGLFLGWNKISDVSPLAELTNLRTLHLTGNKISDVSPLAELTNLERLQLEENEISDVSPLSELTNLRILHLTGNQISDVSSFTSLTQLGNLHLKANQISDVSPLSELTNLRILHLIGNQISDVRPLSELVNLKELRLEGNPIKDREPLLALLQKNPDVKIYLKPGGEPLPVTLSHFRAEHTDAGVVLKWITESEVDNAGFYIHRSETKEGEFKVVNPTMIQGAGTTSERNTYTWKDTTAKPNTAYYYRIEDISHAGVRKQLATVHMRGLVSATGKLTTMWADLKTHD